MTQGTRPDARMAEAKTLDAPTLRQAAREHIDQLMGVLRQEDKVYKRLLSLSPDLREAVLKRDTDSLTSITRRTDELTEQISRLEREALHPGVLDFTA